MSENLRGRCVDGPDCAGEAAMRPALAATAGRAAAVRDALLHACRGRGRADHRRARAPGRLCRRLEARKVLKTRFRCETEVLSVRTNRRTLRVPQVLRLARQLEL